MLESSSWTLLPNSTLRSWRKCPDHRHEFSCKKDKLYKWIRVKGASFWGTDLKFILVMKNDFQRYIICLCLKSFTKSKVFWDSLWNWQLKFVLYCVQDQPGFRIRIWDHSRLVSKPLIQCRSQNWKTRFRRKLCFSR